MVVPDATLVNAQVAYNCNCGYYICLTYSIILGTRPASITACIGGFYAIDKIFLIPIIP